MFMVCFGHPLKGGCPKSFRGRISWQGRKKKLIFRNEAISIPRLAKLA